VWRLHHNHISTDDNLVRQGVLRIIDQLCVGGCGNSENVVHLFLHCDFYHQIWNVV